MTETDRHRIKFYSKEDMSIGHQLNMAEGLLDNYQNTDEFNLIDLFEFHNIKLYFDNNLFLTNWTENKKNKYIKIIEKASKTLNERILSINNDSIEKELKSLDYNYFDNFWDLINNLNVCKNISSNTFTELLQNNPNQIYHILTQKKLIEKFDKEIRNFLVAFDNTAEILLSSLEEKKIIRNKEISHFPKSLSIYDKETIINSYIDKDEPNLNYIRLIENSKDSNEFKLNPKTRLKAKKKSEELNNKILKSGNSWELGISVVFNKDQVEPVRFNSSKNDLEVSYSESFIDRFTDNVNLFRVFKYLFLFTDNKNLISLVSKQSESGVLERIFMQSKNEYSTSFAFQRKENLSNIQLFIFDHYLKRKGNSIESLINSYIEFINEKINPHAFLFKISINEASYLEKIKIIAPDFEFLLKQFKTFVDEKCIDMELIQFNSSPIRLSEIYSLKGKKYLYTNNDLIFRLKYLFFSDQSSLFYIDNFENKYHCLYDLLINENIRLEYFKNYQIESIESLIKDEYLKINDQGYLEINKQILIYIIGEIHKNEVISYWNYSDEIRAEIDILITKDLLVVENTLFTRQEKSYINYYLNKKEFTNGFDLRNKYLHGTNSHLESEHKFDYYRLLKIIILTLLKIDDDIGEIEKQIVINISD